MSLELAQKIADAVLYEGYLLYPYRASAAKNRIRWQFGVLVPRRYSEAGAGEPWMMQTECLVEPAGAPILDVTLRFLRVQARTVETAIDLERDRFAPVQSLEIDGRQFITWEEGHEQAIDLPPIALTDLLTRECSFPLDLGEVREFEPLRDAAGKTVGRIVRRQGPISGAVRIRVEAVEKILKVRIRIENLSDGPEAGADRIVALRRSLVSAHTLLALRDGVFVSCVDPPDWARAAAASCANLHTWPVLVGECGTRTVMLSAPIILYDYPQVAPESPGDLFDATEIDEILTLRVMTLTDEEKREARGTDPRAAAVLDRIDALPAEILQRLHGAVRSLRPGSDKSLPEAAPPSWWEPGADASVSPETDGILVNGFPVSKGTRVRLRPGARRADAQDMFFEGRMATVEGVFFDVDGKNHVAVTLADDPAADLHQSHGRFLYFSPDEIEPLDNDATRRKMNDAKEG